MSGGADQASSITKGAYGSGFLAQTLPFALEDTFQTQEKSLAARLNEAASIRGWWSIFYDELPWALAKTRGWVEPTINQWELTKKYAQQFKTLHGAQIESYFLLRGNRTKDMQANVLAEWSTSAASFSERLERLFTLCLAISQV